MKPLLCILALTCAFQSLALEAPLSSPVTLTIVVDKLDLISESDGVGVGTDRDLVSRYAFTKPILVETNGVTITGLVRLDCEVVQPTVGIAVADGGGKTYDALTRARQAFVARREAMSKLRPAIVAAKERAEHQFGLPRAPTGSEVRAALRPPTAP